MPDDLTATLLGDLGLAEKTPGREALSWLLGPCQGRDTVTLGKGQ